MRGTRRDPEDRKTGTGKRMAILVSPDSPVESASFLTPPPVANLVVYLVTLAGSQQLSLSFVKMGSPLYAGFHLISHLGQRKPTAKPFVDE